MFSRSFLFILLVSCFGATAATNSENALSDSSEEKIGGNWDPLNRGTWHEEPAPPNAPLVNVQAMQVAQMAVPLVNLAYTWRHIPVTKTDDEQAQVKAAQAVIKEFPDEPGVVLSESTDYEKRGYATSGYIPDFAGKGATRNAVIIGFPGTETASDVMTDIQAATATDWKKVGTKQWRVASGFLTRYKDHLNEEDFGSQLLKYVKKINPEYIYIVGHSLGGAISAMCGADFATNQDYKGYKIVVITFGQPRAFDYETATEVENLFKPGNKNGNEYWRIMQYGDVVPDLPDTQMGFEHAGRPFELNKKIWTGKWQFQEQRQDWSPHIWGTTWTAHVCTTAGKFSTHFMTEYECRLDELHKQVVADDPDALKTIDTSVRVSAAVNDILPRPNHRILAFGGVFVLVAFLFFLRARKRAQEDSVYIALMNSTEQEI